VKKKFTVVNTPVHNIDGIAKVTGRAKYTFDIMLPNMLHGKILRSPHPHAKILNIDTSKAEGLVGVKAVVTGQDTLGIKQGIWRRFKELCDEEILARNTVRYIGEPVAAVAANDEDTAEEALDLIEVEYEPFPGVFEPTSPAISSGAMWKRDLKRLIMFVRIGSGAPHRLMCVWRPMVQCPVMSQRAN